VLSVRLPAARELASPGLPDAIADTLIDAAAWILQA
jgi:hypothetical protein